MSVQNLLWSSGYTVFKHANILYELYTGMDEGYADCNIEDILKSGEAICEGLVDLVDQTCWAGSEG